MKQKEIFQAIILSVFITFCTLFLNPAKALAFWTDALFFILGTGAEIIIDDWKNPQQFSGDYLIETIPNKSKFATLYLPNGSAILVPSTSKKIPSGKLGGIAVRGAYSFGDQLTVSIWNATIEDFNADKQKYNETVARGLFAEKIVEQKIIDENSTYFEAINYKPGYYSFVRSTFYEGVVYFLHYQCSIEEKDARREFALQTLDTLKYR